MIALRNDFTTFSRRADAKIGLLKEVIDRVQRGEEVDVERILGTNDKEKESEWEEVLREIEEEDRLWQSKARKKGDQILSSETYPEQPQHNVGDNMETTGPTSTVEPDAISAQNASDDIKKAKRPVGFY
ncbi:hypothetical protein MMC24_002573 [Lignoscripta atroalba]|nr:hypothetical protein [Lignoscripta atroalba]